MITGNDFYNVMAAVVPLYVPMILAYASVRWWKIFSPQQCSGINSYVSNFVVPLLTLKFLSLNNPYEMNFRFIAADALQKVVIIIVLSLWLALSKKASLEWAVSFFSLSTLPNTLVIGIPVLKAMYGDSYAGLMIQIVAMQSLFWNNILLCTYEYRAAKILLNEQFPKNNGGSIKSLYVESDIISLCDHDDSLQVDSEIGDDGTFHIVLRRSISVTSSSFMKSPRMASNLTDVDIYSLDSFREEPTPAQASGKNYRSATLSYEEELQKNETHKRSLSNAGTDLHMFVWTTSTTSSAFETRPTKMNGYKGKDGNIEEPKLHNSPNDEDDERDITHQMPPTSVVTKLIFIMVWRKFIRNPNTYGSLLGIVWSLVSFRWDLKLPTMIDGCFQILFDGGLGLGMFSLGLFISLQPKFLQIGKSMTAFAMAVRFLIGPAVMAATAVALGIRGDLLHAAIVQAALPLSVTTFVFARQYDVKADLLSTTVVFGMMISIPVMIIYYILLGL